MANRWGIPKDVEQYVIARDRACVYCQVEFSSEPGARANHPSWEHIINDIKLNGRNNVARCCIACNASKGNQLLLDWLQTSYCLKKGITASSVAEVVQRAIADATL